jgi:two-component system chemotaxis response regulator CheB
VAGHDLVVIGASAGGVEALGEAVGSLPADLPAAVLVVLHLPSNSNSALPGILGRRGSLPAEHAVHGEPIRGGRIYVAPPDRHLLVADGHVHLSRGPRENGHRPAVDPLFRSAARYYGPRVIGVVLSGALDDGTAGLLAIKGQGGVAVAQDPKDALYPGMPSSAIQHAGVDHVAPAAAMGAVLDRLVRQPAPGGPRDVPEELQFEVDSEELAMSAQDQHRPGRPSGFGCPDCNGVLWEIDEANLIRFRCRVGHAWSQESLVARQSETLESALWVALRSLEERAALSHRLAAFARNGGHPITAARFEEQAKEAEAAAAQVRPLLDRAASQPADGDGTGGPPTAPWQAEPGGEVAT